MKIGLLTYHHVANMGSILQASAAFHLLRSVYPGTRVEIIDYCPAESRAHNAVRRSIKEPRQQWFSRRRKWRDQTYSEFIRNECVLSAEPVPAGSTEEVVARIQSTGYDIVYVGSDTVFQMNGYLGNLIAGPPAPNAYFLPGLKSARKIGLCVSVDPFRKEDLPSARAERVAPALRDFEFIFYRDEATRRVLDSLGVDEERIAFCPDPTIIFDFTRWVDRSPSPAMFNSSKRPVGVSVGNSGIRKKVVEILHARGFSTCMLLGPATTPMEIGLKYGTVGSVLGAYPHLAGLVTDRFHGSIIGLHLGDYPVVGIEDSTVYADSDGKLRDMYHRLGFDNRVVRCSPESLRAEMLWDAWESAVETKLDVLARFADLKRTGLSNLARLHVKWAPTGATA